VLGLVSVGPGDQLVGVLARLALFSVLFTDGMQAGLGELRRSWPLSARALPAGLPLALAFTALLARWVAGLPWAEALLLGAVLSPTDPVLAAAIVGRQQIPDRLRRLLNVESGLNDGLALPLVIVLLAVAGEGGVSPAALAAEVLGGLAIGVVLPLAALRLAPRRLHASAPAYEPLGAVGLALAVYALASLTHANLYLAAFTAGAALATAGPPAEEAFRRFGDPLTELLKLGALLVFGALISPRFLGEIGPGGYVFALAVLVVVRPVALGLALAGTDLPRHERVVAAWFGPKGFASVVYGLLVLDASLPRADELFHLVALVVAASVLAHSSTDVLVARSFEGGGQPHADRQ